MSSYSIDKRGETTRQDMRGSGTAVTLAENTYDDLGRLKTSKPASNESLKLTYDYNVRSWLTNIAGQKLTERLYYNIPFESGTPRYNGNISSAMWNLWDYYLGFNYTYDNLSRLTAGESFLRREDDAPGTSYGAYDTWYRYDRNGNMTALSRLEDLSLEEVDISHSGNQISRITNKGDLYPDYYSGFVSYSDGSAYAYNANGAMTSDPDKGAQYAYNAFGMPSQVKVPAILGSIDYKYSATGERLEASYKWHSGLSLDPQENVNRPTYTATNSSKLRQYVGNKVYENGSLKRILLDNGYIEGGIYYFYLRDHLGNNSVVAKADGQVVQRNHYYPYGKTIGNGESWGQAAQPYKFGGKEEETMFGLELYDFHARQMDRRTGEFLGVDPMCEKYYSISPYAYCAGNPVRYVDPRGKEIININGGVKFTGQDAITAFIAIRQLNNASNGGLNLNKFHLVYQSRTPEIYNHTLNSFRMGKPEILHYDADMQRRTERRKTAMAESGLKPAPGVERDEYPYASTFEGGHGANVIYVPKTENRSQGGSLGILYSGMKTGDPFLVVPVPESIEKDPVSQPIVSPQGKPLKQPQGVGSTVSDGLSIGVVAYGLWTVLKWAAAGVAAPETGGASLGAAAAIP